MILIGQLFLVFAFLILFIVSILMSDPDGIEREN